ncbi:MbcA/ParS/Xre antitoxin family protein [Pseudomonas sp. GD03766]|uniref:MbcA/ParS/Xre antitoxin family protein n=1 Tax=unclassified Pseudomonas TaxID=196821 RepID=UPI0024482755|nr:MbcA/ParS/Xre antitoxin family protein [Pseudomonas sp. GD03766]MDH1692351.1 MbcA/ParS/Xre antitoxin family protein [Pseudomonas sp. GD03766]
MTTMPPDHQARYLEVLDAAQRLYKGDPEAAQRWMTCPCRAFGGKAPASMITTRIETDTVIDFARRFEHGFGA